MTYNLGLFWIIRSVNNGDFEKYSSCEFLRINDEWSGIGSRRDRRKNSRANQKIQSRLTSRDPSATSSVRSCASSANQINYQRRRSLMTAKDYSMQSSRRQPRRFEKIHPSIVKICQIPVC